ncbi:MAG: CHAD domain-containing protein [Mariprofundaceae bacterium]|nr:CHAD domain-containing protein [Mariprofundaceae bacterium]
MDTSPKLDIALRPDMPAHMAITKILQHLFQAMEINKAELIADRNTESLHDFRVAIRRTRTALAQIRDVLPQQVQERFRPEFAWLGNETTPVRDLDVYLLNFDAYQHALPACMQADLESLRVFLMLRRKQSQQTLMRHLRSARYRRLKQDWRGFLDHGSPEASMPVKAGMPVRGVAGRNIGRLFRRALREGGAIHPDSPPEALHKLRKTCKKLRYLMEFFRRLYPRHEIDALIGNMKQLQDNLGMFQDLAVQCALLQEIDREMKTAGGLSEASGRAMEVLIDALRQRQDTSRKAFASCFDMFAHAKNRRRIKRMFGRTHA